MKLMKILVPALLLAVLAVACTGPMTSGSGSMDDSHKRAEGSGGN